MDFQLKIENEKKLNLNMKIYARGKNSMLSPKISNFFSLESCGT